MHLGQLFVNQHWKGENIVIFYLLQFRFQLNI